MRLTRRRSHSSRPGGAHGAGSGGAWRLVALVLGVKARGEIRASQGTQGGAGLALAGQPDLGTLDQIEVEEEKLMTDPKLRVRDH